MSINAPDWMEDVEPARPRYSLSPRYQADLAKALLERQFGAEIGGFLHAQFLADKVSLSVETHGFDKDGAFEDNRGSCLRGYDPQSVHERVSIKVGLHGAPVRISKQEMTDLRFPPGSPRARQHARDQAKAARTNRIKAAAASATDAESGWI